jgi:hypothetical protein
LIHSKQIKDSKPLSLGDDLIEHRITLLVHIVLVHIQLRGDVILPIFDDGEVPTVLEVAPKPMVMKLSGPLIGVIISVDH